jgi:hypothetical protein
MGYDIGTSLSLRAVCFDFRSTNVGSSVIGTIVLPVLMALPINDICTLGAEYVVFVSSRSVKMR